MLNLLPHHRIHIPNGIAIFAALLLLVSSVVGIETEQELRSSGHEMTSSSRIESTKNDSTGNAASNERKGLNLGLLLFRR